MIVKKVLDFLRDLQANNNREWFAANKARYKEADEIVNALAVQLVERIGRFDASVKGLSLRDVTYRIYRDTRFSLDKTPYKTHFGIYVCPGGKKSGNAGYYLHIEPRGTGHGSSGSTHGGDTNENPGMIGSHLLDAGIYMPSPEVLKSVRDEIFDNGRAILSAIGHASRSGFELDRSNSLKRTPTGYPTGSEWDEYLKLKDLHLSKFVDDDYILAPDLAERAAADFGTTSQFMELMQRSVQFAHEESSHSAL